MHHFFGNAIFDCMELVATFHKRKQTCRFDEEDSEDTRRVFEKALTLSSIAGEPSKCSPVIFIGLNDAGIDILQRIENAAVTADEGLILNKFVQGTCCRCAAKYLCHEGNPSNPENRIGVVIPIKDEEQKDDEEVFIPYQSSQCHPLFIPIV